MPPPQNLLPAPSLHLTLSFYLHLITSEIFGTPCTGSGGFYRETAKAIRRDNDTRALS